MKNRAFLSRLDERLSAKNLSAAAASVAAGMSKDGIRNSKRKGTMPNSSSIRSLAEVLDCDVDYLLGTSKLVRSKDTSAVNVVGYIGAGAEHFYIDDHEQGAGLERVEVKIESSSVAVIVRGDSMHPVYQDGDILIYSEKQFHVDRFINQRSICCLADGRILVKTITKGESEGLYTLTSFNSGPIENIALAWAARIEWVQPR